MKHLLLWGFALACLFACQPNVPEYHIEGSLPSARYDGEWIYLVPMENASQENIDSTRIVDARFSFRGTKEEMKVLRMRVPLRLKLQELLVVTEPGVTSVRIDSISSASGTPQNDALQQWKEHKQRTDREANLLWSALRSSTRSEDSLRILLSRDSLQEKIHDFNRAFLKEHPAHTTAGKFLDRIIRPTLPEEQERPARLDRPREKHDEKR